MALYKDPEMTEPILPEEYEKYGIGNVEPVTAEELKQFFGGRVEVVWLHPDLAGEYNPDDRIELTPLGERAAKSIKVKVSRAKAAD